MQIITVTADWALVSAQTNVTFQVTGVLPVELGVSTHLVSPDAGIIYSPLQGDRGALYDIWPGSEGNCVWARSSANSTIVITQ